jgi:flagellar biosynthesis protein FlhF
MAVRVRSQITFEAKDEAEAFRVARERLGSDAAILSQRTVRTGGFLGFFRRTVLHVTAGILEADERGRTESDSEKKERLAAFQKLLEFKQSMAVSENGVTSAESGLLTGRKPNSSVSDAGVYSPVAKPPSDPVLRVSEEPDRAQISPRGLALSSEKKESEQEYKTKLEREVSELSERLDRVLKRLESGKDSAFPIAPPEQENRRAVARTEHNGLRGEELLLRLMAQEVSEENARKLAREYEHVASAKSFAEWIAARIPVAAETSWDALGGRKVMLIGPTGVGKTTTIAKLAAIHSLWEKKNVVFMTADTYRIAAPEQLRTYAKILCVPIDVVYDANEIAGIVEKHAKADLLLLDTAGRSQKDSRRVEEIRVLYEAFRPEAVHLVLPANMKYRDMLDVIRRMGVIPISHVLFSKLDETTTYGSLLNILLDFDKPASFFTAGQNVPNDIQVAKGTYLADLLLTEKGVSVGV